MASWKELAELWLGELKSRGATSFFPKPEAVPRLIPQPKKSGFVESPDGTRIFWELHGPTNSTANMNPMVFCYGLVCSMNQWRAQLEHFSQSRECLLVDYRGHHQSEFPRDPRSMNISELSRDVSSAIEAQGWTLPAHVWGHSMGCNVALELAFSRPELVQSLVLCCGTPRSPFRNMLHIPSLEAVVEPLLKSYPKNPKPYDWFWKAMMLQPKLTQAIARLVGFHIRGSTEADTKAYALAVANVDPRVFFPLLLEMCRGGTENILAKIRTPTLVLAGGSDHVTPPSEQQRLAELLKRAQYVEVPSGSHNLQLDYGEYINLKAEKFWAAL